MKKNIILWIIWIFFCVGIFFHIFFDEANSWSCYTNVEKNISGNSMNPLFKNGEKVYFLIWYYRCNNLQRGDIIAYDFANTGNIYMKILYGFPGDKIFFEENKIFINNKELKNSSWNSYFFTDAEIQLMNLFIKNNILDKWSYFIFWDNIWNSDDSRKFWAIWEKNIVWKFNKIY